MSSPSNDKYALYYMPLNKLQRTPLDLVPPRPPPAERDRCTALCVRDTLAWLLTAVLGEMVSGSLVV